MSKKAISPLFLPHLSPSQREEADKIEDLDQLLSQVMDMATASWPGVVLAPDHFMAYLAQRVPVEGELAPYLRATQRLSDLYLACGCAQGDVAAIAAFEATHLPDIQPALAWLGLPGSAIEEMQQRLRQQLFVAEPGSEPKIAQYSGRSRLRRWVRVAAVHGALQQLQREKRLPQPAGDLPVDLAGVDETPELHLLKREHLDDFKEAMELALTQLAPRQQNLLRYLYLDGLTTEQIGSLYSVHRSTASRWLTSAREDVLSQARGILMQQLGLDQGQCDSLMRVLSSQVELTLSRVLKRESK